MLQICHALNEMMVSNEVSATINYSCENERFNKLPPKMNVSMPKFIPKQINKKNSSVYMESSLHFLPH